ncbi:hypothetical protein BN1708_020162, partial [Verticillium longisporum]
VSRHRWRGQASHCLQRRDAQAHSRLHPPPRCRHGPGFPPWYEPALQLLSRPNRQGLVPG